MDCTCCCIDCIEGTHCGGRVNYHGDCYEFGWMDDLEEREHLEWLEESEDDEYYDDEEA
jgi:hypothetical protein